MCFVVKGNIYHHQTPACQNMFPLKQKIALKMREKTCAIERRNEVHESFPNSVPPARSLMSRQRCSTVTRRCREGNKEISKLHLFSNINFYIFSVNYDVSVTFLYPSPSKKKAVWGGGTSNCSWTTLRAWTWDGLPGTPYRAPVVTQREGHGDRSVHVKENLSALFIKCVR